MSSTVDRVRLRDAIGISTFRVSLTLGATFVVGLIVMLSVVYIAMARDLTARSDRILHAAADQLVHVPADQLPARIGAELGRDCARLDYLALVARDGSIVTGNVRPVAGLEQGQPIDVEDSGNGPYRLLAVRTRQGETLLIGRDISLLRDLRRTILETLIVSGLLTLVCVTLAAIHFSQAPLRRVQALQRASREIAQGNFSIRMPIAGRRDELDQFATTVNATVEEVGRVVAQVKGVTDAIAHDLRTPLTRVRATLADIGRDPADTGAVSVAADRASRDLDLVLERFAALLRISELEAGQRRAGFRSVNLGILVEQISDLYEPLAEDRGIALTVASQPFAIEGDQQLLFEAVSNLVDNAIKFAGSGGTVDIAIRGDASAPAIEVCDDGPGIPPEEREAVLRRFHRGPAAQNVPGSGLGLSVVVAILHLHGFALDLSDGDPGLVARIDTAPFRRPT